MYLFYFKVHNFNENIVAKCKSRCYIVAIEPISKAQTIVE